MQLVQSGIPLAMEYGSYDMQPGLFVRLKLFDVTGVPTLEDTVNLTHIVNGGYIGLVTLNPNKNYYVSISVYTDNTYTTRNTDYSPSSQSYYAMNILGLVSSVYLNKMSTAYNSIGGNQELLVWAEKSGQRVLASTACTVVVKNALGVTEWSDTLASPNADGIFKFVKPFAPISSVNYYIIISITVDAAVRTSNQAFFTVG